MRIAKRDGELCDERVERVARTAEPRPSVDATQAAQLLCAHRCPLPDAAERESHGTPREE